MTVDITLTARTSIDDIMQELKNILACKVFRSVDSVPLQLITTVEVNDLGVA